MEADKDTKTERSPVHNYIIFNTTKKKVIRQRHKENILKNFGNNEIVHWIYIH